MRFSLSVLCLVFLSLSAPPPPPLVSSSTLSQESSPGLFDARVPFYESNDSTFVQALIHLASKAKIPLGVEWIETEDTLAPLNTKFENASYREILTRLIKDRPHYEWEISNGVVHVFPKGAMEDPTDFVNLYQGMFEVKNERVAVASYRLRLIIQKEINPPLPKIAGQGAVSAEGIGGSVASGLGDSPLTFRLEHVRVRDILDTFAIKSDLKIWVVTRPSQYSLEFGRIQTTKSIYSKSVIPARSQPLWETMIWGFDPVAQTFRQDWYERKMAPDPKN